MPTIVETEVYTLDELAALGDERVVERALTWIADTLVWLTTWMKWRRQHERTYP